MRYIKKILLRLANIITLSLLNRVRHINKQLDDIRFMNSSTSGKVDQLAQANIALLKADIESIKTKEYASNEIVILNGKRSSLEHALSNLASTEEVLNLDKKITYLDKEMSKTVADAMLKLKNIQQKVDKLLQGADVFIEGSDFLTINPEVSLMCYLRPSLNSNLAIDVGAHTGEVSKQLVQAGYEVHAFEASPVIFNSLQRNVGNTPNCHIYNMAIGSKEEEGTLHIFKETGEDKIYNDCTLFSTLVARKLPKLEITKSEKVNIRTISSLQKDGALDSNIGLIKIDTEGFDLEVIYGMEKLRPSVVVAEYWDTANPWGGKELPYTYQTLIKEMNSRNYGFYIDIYRLWGNEQCSFTCNHNVPVGSAWGNLFFFNQAEDFNNAYQWCSAMLPRTIFKPLGDLGDDQKH